MAIDFPTSPSVGDTATADGITYKWDGSSWVIATGAVRNAVDTMSSGTIDYSSGSYHVLDLDSASSSATLSVSNLPTTPEKHTLQVNFTEEPLTDMDSASYDNVSFSVSGQDTVPSDVAFKSDGTKMYIVGDTGNTVDQYSLSTAWDLSTASYDSVTFSVGFQEANPGGIFFKPDGTKMYVTGYAGDDVNQYTLSTAWDLSTASYDSVTFSVASQQSSTYGIHFKSDGTKMYIVGFSPDTVFQYSLSTAWDVSTASYDSVSFSVTSQAAVPRAVKFNASGVQMFILDGNLGTVHQYSLSTAWDLSTASYDSVSFGVSSQDAGPLGMFFKPDFTKMYIVGNGNDTVYQYSTNASYDITWPSEFEFNENTPPTAPTTQSSLILELYNPDNTKIYATQKFNNG